jgi:hypothetical protein
MITYVFDSCELSNKCVHQIRVHRDIWCKPVHEMMTDEVVIAQLSALPKGIIDCELHKLAGYAWHNINSSSRELNEARLLTFIKEIINGECN